MFFAPKIVMKAQRYIRNEPHGCKSYYHVVDIRPLYHILS